MRPPSPQAIERLLDAVEVGDVGDDPREVDLARERERREPRQLCRRVTRAVVGAAQRLLGEELDRRQRHLDARAARARRRPPSPPGRSTSQASRIVSGRPIDLERVVDAAAR